MAQYQSISVTFPKMHGNAPRNLAMVINRPSAPRAQVKFNSFKDAMEYLKKEKAKENEDKE